MKQRNGHLNAAGSVSLTLDLSDCDVWRKRGREKAGSRGLQKHAGPA